MRLISRKYLRTFSLKRKIRRSYEKRECIYELLEGVFATVNRRYIAVRYNNVFSTNDNTKNIGYYFTCRNLSNAIDYLIDNSFVCFGSKVFRQVIGILMGRSMGTNCAPLLADLFLHTYKYKLIDY